MDKWGYPETPEEMFGPDWWQPYQDWSSPTQTLMPPVQMAPPKKEEGPDWWTPKGYQDWGEYGQAVLAGRDPAFQVAQHFAFGLPVWGEPGFPWVRDAMSPYKGLAEESRRQMRAYVEELRPFLYRSRRSRPQSWGYWER